MKVLVVGSGGREHALGWKLTQSPLVSELISAPGNPGLEELGRCVPIKADSATELAAFAAREQVGLVVIGPESAAFFAAGKIAVQSWREEVCQRRLACVNVARMAGATNYAR